MDAQQFLAEFGYIANAPNGIVKLRELVLQLAISGRLVERAETFQPVQEIIKTANTLRKEYEESLKLRSTRMHPPLSKIPFMIPEHWKWERLEKLCIYIQRGKGPKYADKSSTYVVSQKCIQWNGFDLTPARHVADDSLEKYGKERYLRDGDLLWNSTGTGTAGRVAIYSAAEEKSAVADSHVTVIRLANCSPRYFWCVFASPWIQLRIDPSHSDSLVSGTTQQVELNTTTVRGLPIPLPPLEEQSRIVAKVDELMALCNQLEAQQQQRRTLQNQLRHATLQAIATSQSPHELQENWQRLEANFGQLFSTPEDVKSLRAIVLDLAVTGYLSEESATDESVLDFLKRNEIGKQARLASGKMKRKKVSSTDIFQLDLDVPEHWTKIALEELFQFIDYRGKTPTKTESGAVLVTAKNVRPGRISKEPIEYVSEKSYKQWMTRGFPKMGDLLFTTEAPLGNVALIEEEPAFALAQRVIDLQPLADLNTRCTMYFIMSPTFQSLLERNSTGMTAKGIKAAKLKQLKLPIPPIPEQARIVKRVDQLMTICDELENILKNANKLANSLSRASVATLTGIAIEQEEEPMKVPQTELVAPVRLGAPPNVKAQAPLATILARQNGEMSARDLWQRFGGEIDAFYAQLKTEVAYGWLLEPAPAEMLEK